jgi:eukaryotic-like serine/threonine-protein kinase
MTLPMGVRLGSYEVLSAIGAGGMGEVYLARDSKLRRDVAIKVLPEAFARDPARVLRFEREAKLLATLNHPNIAAIYGIEDSNSSLALVMEYVDGTTLADRIRAGPIPLDEALPIARQIADALEYAHEHGVVHRDLKPANVKVTSDDAVKILDFGLAKAVQGEASSDDLYNSPTLSHMATGAGVLLGTAAYMSPEQAKAKPVDRRADIWAFGCLLYEMFTATKAFHGETVAETLATVLRNEPDWSLLPVATPARVRVLLQRCLQKDTKQRLRDIGDARISLDEILSGVPDPAFAGIMPDPSTRWHHLLPWALFGFTALALAGLALVHFRNNPDVPAAEVRFQIPVPDKLSFQWYDWPSVSPDGERIAFTTSDYTFPLNGTLFVRPLNAETATKIPIPTGASEPFWSPDGQQIAFFSRGVGVLGALQRVDASGGSPVTICLLSGDPRGGAWSRDGVVLFSQQPDLLYRVNAAGGDAKPLRSLAESETAQRFPQFLPDGKHYLYLSMSSRPDQQGIYGGSLDSNERKFIVSTDAQAAYVEPGQLLFMRGNVLMAQPFDLRNLKLQGEPRQVSDNIARIDSIALFPGAIFAASPNGVLVWRRASQSTETVLQWVDRSGKKLEVVGEPADYTNPALSPDNRRLAIDIRDPRTKTRDIWIFDLVRGTKTRMTQDPAESVNSTWSPDGTRMAFTSDHAGQRDIYQLPADGSGSPDLLLGGKGGQKNVEDWSMDGRYLVYNYSTLSPTRIGLYILPLTGDRKPVPFVIGVTAQRGQFSPNGRWLAYRSLESGKSEVYVREVTPGSLQPGRKWTISTGGGDVPRWRRDGKELFYYSGTTFYAVGVKTGGPKFEAGVPTRLFDATTLTKTPNGSPFVVSSDGQRFLILAPSEALVGEPLQVVMNWQTELK